MKKRRPLVRTRPLALESLEDRRLLASVAFNQRTGALTVTGTNAAEVVSIKDIGNGVLVVTGTGITGTAINEDNQVVVGRNFANVRSISIDMRGGADRVDIGSGAVAPPPAPAVDDAIELQGPLNVKLGLGSDRAYIYVNTPGSVTVDGGADNSAAAQDDRVYILKSIIGSLAVNTYAGNDVLKVESSVVSNLAAIVGVDRLRAGQVDSDRVEITDSAVGSCAIQVGTAQQPRGANTIEVVSSIFNTLGILGGDAVDQVIINSDGVGIGDGLDEQLIDLVDDLEPFLGRLPNGRLNPLTSALDSQLRSLASQFGVNLGGFSLSQLDFSLDLSDQLAAFFAFNPLDGVGQNTTVFGNLAIKTFAGDDFAALRQVFVGNELSAQMDAGIDEVSANLVSAAFTRFDGGQGNPDAYFDFGNPGLSRKRPASITNFEFFGDKN